MKKSGWEKLFDPKHDDDKASIVDGKEYDNGETSMAHVSLLAYATGEDDGIIYIIMVKDMRYDANPVLMLPDPEMAVTEYMLLADRLSSAIITGEWPVLSGHSLGAVAMQSLATYHNDRELIRSFAKCDAYERPFIRVSEELQVYHAN